MGLTLPFAQPQLFNTPLEAGVRALLILDAFAPQAFDVATMSLLDYYIVHTGDAGGPPASTPRSMPVPASISCGATWWKRVCF